MKTTVITQTLSQYSLSWLSHSNAVTSPQPDLIIFSITSLACTSIVTRATIFCRWILVRLPRIISENLFNMEICKQDDGIWKERSSCFVKELSLKQERETRRWQCLVDHDNKQEDGNKENGKETWKRRSEGADRPLFGREAQRAPLPELRSRNANGSEREQRIWSLRRQRQKKIKDMRTTQKDNRLACFFLRLLRAFLSPLSLVLVSALVQSPVHCIWLEVIVNWNEF